MQLSAERVAVCGRGVMCCQEKRVPQPEYKEGVVWLDDLHRWRRSADVWWPRQGPAGRDGLAIRRSVVGRGRAGMCVRIQTPKRQAACSLTLRGGGAVGFPGLFRCSVVAHFEPSGLICAQTISRDGTSAQMPGEWGGGPHQQMCSDMENGRPAVQPTATATGSQAAAAVGRPARAPPQKASRGPAACRRVVKLEEAHGIRCRQNMLLVLENTWAGCVRAVWAPTPNSARLGVATNGATWWWPVAAMVPQWLPAPTLPGTRTQMPGCGLLWACAATKLEIGIRCGSHLLGSR
ncbi:hypothetical protein AcV7_002610 [Taiwanofungus camphoratus]|nr:hypothetical protein AcV7_002610 [Antrodia cinnamomea]